MAGTSRTIVVDPPGELRTVDTAPAQRMIERLAGGVRTALAGLCEVLREEAGPRP